MALLKTEAQRVLEEFGFTLQRHTGFGDLYGLPTDTNWIISAYATHEGSPFDGTVDDAIYRRVDFSLGDSYGTCHRCLSLAALWTNGPSTIDELLRVANNDGLLKCPQCGIRYVRLKEPRSGETWAPFLACEGMKVVGSGRSKRIGCKGKSTKLAPLKIHP